MTRKVFLTGKPGVGKTTIVERVVSMLRSKGFKIGGMVTFEVREGGVRKGFMVTDILTGKKGVLAWVGGSGPKIGKYTVNLKDLEEIGVNAIKLALADADIVVVDEVGPMELFSDNFRSITKALIKADKPVIGVVHYKVKDPLIESIKKNPDVKVFEVSVENREFLPKKVLDILLFQN